MIKRFDVEIELSDFNLDRMNPSGRENLIKVARLLGPLEPTEWINFISNSAIDLQAMAKELDIARSSLYQNENIKRYVLYKAEQLYQQGLILELPYQPRDKLRTEKKPLTARSSATDEEVREKDKEIKQLQQQVANLSATVDELKVELKTTKSSLAQNDLRAIHLAQFGRYLR
jgi:hypothetical protein